MVSLVNKELVHIIHLLNILPRNIFFNQSISPAVILASLPSTGLEWEKTHQTDIGVEIGFLNNRYSVEIDYYNKQTKDLLLAKPLPGTAGDTRLENVGEVENKGFEFTEILLTLKNLISCGVLICKYLLTEIK